MAFDEKHQTAKRLYEIEGMSKAAIARQLDVSPQTIGKWSKTDNWAVQGVGPDDPNPTPAAAAFEPAPITQDLHAGEGSFDPAEFARNVYADEAAGIASPEHPDSATHDRLPPVDPPRSSVAELQTEIIALQAKNDDLAEENTRLNPTIDIREMLEDRVAWLTTNTPDGDRYWLNRAEHEWTQMTRDRIASNLPPFDIKTNPEMFQKTIDDLKAKEAAWGNTEPDEKPTRKIKLAIYRGGKGPNDSEDGWLTIEQIPLEGQINNTAGSLADGIIRYTRKGFKIT